MICYFLFLLNDLGIFIELTFLCKSKKHFQYKNDFEVFMILNNFNQRCFDTFDIVF